MNAIQRTLLSLIKAYRILLSPWLGNYCRFEPSCSIYASKAIAMHGALIGSYLAVGRIFRCQPFCRGGCDPVPDQIPRFLTCLSRKSTSR